MPQERQEIQDLCQIPLTGSWQLAADASEPISQCGELGSELGGFLRTWVHQVVVRLYKPQLM